MTLADLQAAISAAWSLETCDPSDVPTWTPAEPSQGQCAVSALVVHDLLGGQLLEAEVLHADGSHQGFHYWNRFVGVDIDLTRRQFREGEVVQPPHLIERLPAFPWKAQEQYVIFRDRVARRPPVAADRRLTGRPTRRPSGRVPQADSAGMRSK